MSFFDLFRRNRRPITIHDWTNFRGGNIGFSGKNVKSCSTDEPRYVIADESQKQYVVYTESLITCLGVLVHGKGQNGDVAALIHALAGNMSEAKRVAKVVEEMIREYGVSELEVVIVIGDSPNQELFNQIVDALNSFDMVPNSNFKLIYAGDGKPGFENGFADPYEYAAKVAYDTRHHGLLVDADKKKK